MKRILPVILLLVAAARTAPAQNDSAANADTYLNDRMLSLVQDEGCSCACLDKAAALLKAREILRDGADLPALGGIRKIVSSMRQLSNCGGGAGAIGGGGIVERTMDTGRGGATLLNASTADAQLNPLTGTYYLEDSGGYRSSWSIAVSGTEITGWSKWTCCPGPRKDPLKGTITDGKKIRVTRDCTGQGLEGPCEQIYEGVLSVTAAGAFTANGSPAGSWSMRKQ